MRVKKTVIVAILCTAVLLAGVSLACAAKTITVALYQSPTHDLSIWINELAPMLKEMSNGELEVKIQDSGTIAKAKEMVDAVQRNLADVGFSYPGANSSTMPVLEVVGSVPFLFHNDYDWWKAWPKIIPVIQKALKEKGYDNIEVCKVPYYGGWYKIAANKEVKVPGDLKDLKVKVLGTGFRDYFASVDGSALSMATSEVYEAASRNLLDGSVGVHTHWTGWKQMEVFDHLLDLPIAPTTMLFYINKTTLDKLGPKLAPILVKYCEQMAAIITINSIVSETQNENIAATKMEFYRPTQEEKKLWYAPAQPIINDWVKRSAPYGQEIVDIVKKAQTSNKKNFLNY